MERKQAMNVSSQGSKAVAEVGSGQRGAMRRKRGRPRKYVPGVTSNSPPSAMDAVPSPRRGRGRPPASARRQQFMSSPGDWLSGSVRTGLMTTFMIIIEVGENIAEKIISFAEEGPKPLCILSVNGSVSSATLRRPSVAGGVVTYEGTKLDILSLSGSLILDEDGASVTGMDGFNITLSSPDGRVIGGCVGNLLIAATRVQVIVGIFSARLKNKTETTSVESESNTETDPEIAEAETSSKPARKKQQLSVQGRMAGCQN